MEQALIPYVVAHSVILIYTQKNAPGQLKRSSDIRIHPVITVLLNETALDGLGTIRWDLKLDCS